MHDDSKVKITQVSNLFYSLYFVGRTSLTWLVAIGAVQWVTHHFIDQPTILPPATLNSNLASTSLADYVAPSVSPRLLAQILPVLSEL